MFMFESEVFLGYFLEVSIERNLLFVHQMKHIWNVTQSEVVGESECHTAIFYLFLKINTSYKFHDFPFMSLYYIQ